MMDYVLVSQRFRSSVLDTRVYRETYLQSDHMLVVSRVRFKLRAKRCRTTPRVSHQSNPRRLSEEVVSTFQQHMDPLHPLQAQAYVHHPRKDLGRVSSISNCSAEESTSGVKRSRGGLGH